MKCDQIVEIEDQKTCRVANYWAEGHAVPIHEEACKVCVGCSVPRGVNRVTVSLALGKLLQVDQAAYQRKLPASAPHLIPPGAPERVLRYAQASAEWVKQGRPMRSDAEVAQIVEICKSCSEWMPEEAACRLCGCHINGGGPWTNKARRLNEHCPQEKW